jgi:hypothetical protein
VSLLLCRPANQGRRPVRPAGPILAGVFLALSVCGCAADRQPKITVGVDGCSSCGMVIDKGNEACVYYVDREFSAFCSPGCLLRSFETRRKQGEPLPDSIFFADFQGTGFHPSESVSFLLTERIPTVMEWGFISFVDAATAGAHRQHEDELVVDWLGLRTLRGLPDRHLSLSFGVNGMAPEVVELKKGELVEWSIVGRQLGADLRVRLRGYEELGELLIPASGDPVTVRMLATRPGAGFPVVRTDDDSILGQVRVVGPHTVDEEGS